MDNLFAYKLLFLDVLKSNILFIPHKPYVLDVMVYFNLYDKYIMFIDSVFSLIFAAILCYFSGYLIRSFKHSGSYIENYVRYELINKYIQKYWMFILPLSFFSYGSMINIILGLYRISFKSFVKYFSLLSFVYFMVKLII